MKEAESANSDLQVKVGKRIKEIRMSKGLSAAELARRCEMERSHIARVESGGLNFTINYLNRICKGLEITLAELFEGVE
jgi:transcriptional regulator with XRE-family HTH domain